MANEIPVPAAAPPEDLVPRRREEIQHGLRRANRATVAVWLIVVTMAGMTVVQTQRAQRHARAASVAQTEAQNQLWRTRLEQARTARLSRSAEAIAETRIGLAQAARLRVTDELRDEAIACLALPELRPVNAFAAPTDERITFDATFEYYAHSDRAGKLRVVRVAGGAARWEFAVDPGATLEMEFSPDGRFLAAREASGRLRVWELQRGVEVVSRSMPVATSGQSTLTFHPAGNQLAVIADSHSVIVIELPSGVTAAEFHELTECGAVAFHPEGVSLAVGSIGEVQIYNLASKDIENRLQLFSPAQRIAWHPSGRRMAVACADNSVNACELAGNRARREFGRVSGVVSLFFIQRGRWLVVGGQDGQTRFWNSSSEDYSLAAHGIATAANRAGGQVAFDRNDGRVELCEWRESVAYDTLATPMGLTIGTHWVDISAGGQMVVAASRDAIVLWDRAAGTPGNLTTSFLRRFPAAAAVQFEAGGQGLVGCGLEGFFRAPILDDPPRGRRFGELEPGAPTEVFPDRFADERLGVTFASGNPSRLTLTRNGKAFFRNLEIGATPVALPWLTNAQVLALAPGTNFAATLSSGGRDMVIWDLGARKPVKTIAAAPWEVANARLAGARWRPEFSPDGRWLFARNSEGCGFWDSRTWQRHHGLVLPELGGALTRVTSAFSPDGRMFAVATEPGMITLVNVESGRPVARLHAPSRVALTHLRFDPTGNYLVAGTARREVPVWNLRVLRDHLAELGMKTHPDFTPADGAAAPSDRRATAGADFASAGLLPAGGTVLALLCGLWTLRYQRRLVKSHAELDALVLERQRQLQRAQTELLHHEKMKALGTLAAGVAHEFNNLLSVIRLSGQLVDRELQPTGEAKENLAAIEQAAAQGKEIVRSMLGYSRDTADRVTRHAISTLVTDTVALLGRQFLSGVALTLELDPATPDVQVARSRVEQILLNFLVNASEAMTGQGKLRISAQLVEHAPDCVLAPRPAPPCVQLSVSDSGPGIPPEILPHIWEPFFTTKTVGAGTGAGLGLSLVHTIAAQDGFGLAVESLPGQGATLHLYLPIVHPEPSSKP